MKPCMTHARLAAFVLFAALATVVSAQTFEISTFIVAGGGSTSTGGGFEVSGTIGQPAATSMTQPPSGSNFTMVGGYWPIANQCTLIGDVNRDGVVDGSDLQGFLNCLLGANAANCGCADFDSGGVGTS